MLNSTSKSYLKLMIFVIMYVFSIIKYSFGQPIQKGLKTFNIDLVKKKIYGWHFHSFNWVCVAAGGVGK